MIYTIFVCSRNFTRLRATSTWLCHHPISLIPKVCKRNSNPVGLSRLPFTTLCWLMSFLCYASRRPSTMLLDGPDRGIILFRETSSSRRSVMRITRTATSPETRCRRSNLLSLTMMTESMKMWKTREVFDGVLRDY